MHADDVTARRIILPIGSKGRGGTLYFHFSERERIQHLFCRAGIVLIGGNHKSRRVASLNVVLVYLVEVLQHVLAAHCRLVEQRFKRDLLVIHDVAKMPGAAHPLIAR